MKTKVQRKIIRIDEAKCNGCGLCIIACAEGALELRDGKAKLVSEKYCDGLAACIGECPEGALTISEREAEEFDEAAVEHHLHEKEHAEEKLPCGCPSVTVTRFERAEEPSTCVQQKSTLGQWPVQLALVPPHAPYLNQADLLLSADCVPYAYAGFHQDFLCNHALLVACPKLDDFEAHLEKLTDVLSQAQVKSLTVLRMEVPCCSGLSFMAKKALAASGKALPFKEVVIGIRGETKE